MKNFNKILPLLFFSVVFAVNSLPKWLYSQQAGTLDSSFGNNGIVLFETDYGINSWFLDKEEKLFLLGNSESDSGPTILKYHLDGTPDYSFGVSGKVHIDIEGIDYGGILMEQEDGKILLAASIPNNGDNSLYNTYDFFLTRFLEDGNLDTGFGNQGQLIIDLGLRESVRGLALQDDKKILLSGSTGYNGAWGAGNTDIVLIRLMPDASFDSSFAEVGIVITDLHPGTTTIVDEGGKIFVQPDGEIIMLGLVYNVWGGGNQVIIRYETTGITDTTFGVNGVFDDTSIPYSGTEDIALQNNHSIILAGGGADNWWQWETNYFFLMRQLTPEGQLDTTFADKGVYQADSSKNYRRFQSVKIQNDNKILITGILGADMLVMRFLADGEIDTFFAEQGTAIVQLQDYQTFGGSVYLSPEGKITVLGHAYNLIDSSGKILIARFNNDVGNPVINPQVADQFYATVFPNPAIDHITISLLNSGELSEIAITDFSGKIVYEVTANHAEAIEVNTANFAAGFYIIRIQTTDLIINRKLVLVK